LSELREVRLLLFNKAQFEIGLEKEAGDIVLDDKLAQKGFFDRTVNSIIDKQNNFNSVKDKFDSIFVTQKDYRDATNAVDPDKTLNPKIGQAQSLLESKINELTFADRTFENNELTPQLVFAKQDAEHNKDFFISKSN
jgi:hypothetical protein